MDECIFCKIIGGEIPARIIDETDRVIVILSLQNHPLVISKQHIETIFDMDDETGCAVMTEAIKIAKAVKIGLQAEGVNLVQNNGTAANQEVMHFHLHIKPRFPKDEVQLHFPQKSVTDEEKTRTVSRIKSALGESRKVLLESKAG